MKIRIHKNSIRLRLSQSDVAGLAQNGCVEERLEFGPDMLSTFRCALRSEANAQAVTARYLPGVIEIIVPADQVHQWTVSNEVAINGLYSGSEKPISIAIEKDFQCLHKGGEQNADAFPNPALAVDAG